MLDGKARQPHAQKSSEEAFPEAFFLVYRSDRLTC